MGGFLKGPTNTDPGDQGVGWLLQVADKSGGETERGPGGNKRRARQISSGKGERCRLTTQSDSLNRVTSLNKMGSREEIGVSSEVPEWALTLCVVQVERRDSCVLLHPESSLLLGAIRPRDQPEASGNQGRIKLKQERLKFAAAQLPDQGSCALAASQSTHTGHPTRWCGQEATGTKPFRWRIVSSSGSAIG
ncbi:hypothetical protein EYF80_003449 [Liparis tanakae]|uniref:Uncharacterized protein n=1 Tax=Liparis tanakae TaxID=230148 RepID=A0A4Z2J986_9TELE|nr:hypothetical protein EYF80_003449 [Liparis tanakae]